MRIIAGRHRGLHLAEVGKGDPAAHLRPTTDRVRESLFNLLAGGRFGDPITGAVVLDLFAGTGALGLEALSRGAAHVTLVDSGRVAQKLIRDNIARLQRQSDAALLAADASALPPRTGPAADLVFLDPPYGADLGGRALIAARKSGWIADGALVVAEENGPLPPPAGFTLLESRRYGDTHITLLRAEPQPQPAD
ncbi:16S rRNA (guanine966-N2)-methyltransferase [Ketogulonicigenium robustum]|uniref:16S rRNA (Guanine966-N2)-methyltransferase n=1 Tax=Ketogulonicigenium robustum TaxID=92947 RepID=A0A1W6NWR3_9RHOB|nr:16S rRNA (guanine(966)-N(2))-methyltransferase RsmD [Ketogulonicigenium robustum]ARO13672.1 16S rRNA (guanine966-N2)-methyltransferase [Ketogulonicigenium robustum]